MTESPGMAKARLVLLLNRLRTEAGMSQIALAESAHVGPASLSRYLSADRVPSFNDLQAILYALGVDDRTMGLMMNLGDRARSESLTKPFRSIVPVGDDLYWDALASAPHVIIYSGSLLPFPVRSDRYQRRLVTGAGILNDDLMLRIQLWQMTTALLDRDADIVLVMCESALRRCEEQEIEHLMAIADQWTLRVVPLNAGHLFGLGYPAASFSWPVEPELDFGTTSMVTGKKTFVHAGPALDRFRRILLPILDASTRPAEFRRFTARLAA